MLHHIQLSRALIAISFKQQLEYRWAVFGMLFTNFFFGIIRIAILEALYDGQTSVAGFARADIYTYTALTQMVIGYLSIFGWSELLKTVHRGEVTMDLLKPLSLLHYWLTRDFGRALADLLLRGVGGMLVFAAFFPIHLPQTFTQWSALLISLILAWLVTFLFYFLVNLSAFWTPNAIGIVRFAMTIFCFASGFLMPLRLYPDAVQTLLWWTPFPHTLNTIVEVYLGMISGPAVVQALLVQAVWVMIFWLLVSLVLRQAIKHLVLLGG